MRIHKRHLIPLVREYIRSTEYDHINFEPKMLDRGLDPAMNIYLNIDLPIEAGKRKEGDYNYRIIKNSLKSLMSDRGITRPIEGVNYKLYKKVQYLSEAKVITNELVTIDRHAYYHTSPSRKGIYVYIEVPKDFVMAKSTSKYYKDIDVMSAKTTVSISYEDILKSLGGQLIKITGIKVTNTGLDIVYK